MAFWSNKTPFYAVLNIKNISMNIKQQTVKGTFWSFIERFSVQSVQFIVQIIMARLLCPDDYGLIAMLAIFLAISQAFIDGGFANALVQRKDRTEKDYSSVFYFNIVTGLILFAVFFFSSKAISAFYSMPQLDSVIKVVSVNLVILSFQVVHKAKLTIEIDFKTQAKISLISVFISGTVGIIMAYQDFAYWAIVAQITINNFISTVLYWFMVKWKPLLVFSKQSFKILFSFGSKILMANLLQTFYLNIYTLVIGKMFSKTDVGNYSRADQFATLPSSNITNILQRVTYPILSSIQDDDKMLRKIFRNYMRLFAFVIFPLMTGFALVARPVVLFLIGEKWLGVVPLLEILCFSYMWYPLNAIQQNIMQVKGRSDLFFRLELVKKTIGFILIFISIPYGMKYLCLTIVAYSLISMVLNTWFACRLIKFRIWTQVKDIAKILLITLIMAIPIWFVNKMLIINNILLLIISLIIGVGTYVLSAKLLKYEELFQIASLIKGFRKHK
ncbi:MAG: lipopolysaccharide biosynthesis protein [Bacteroidales bacterium]|jgi:O-antigen/teichoic acid export membrane protein|nr:lipopolysaccharide biosynthesis protein [Bacteroidales bacterium]